MESEIPWFATSVVALYAGLLLYAAYSDIRHLEVANSVVVGIAALFFPAAWLVSLPLETIVVHVAVGLAVLAAGFGLFAFGVMGGADGKLLAATALWCGPDEVARLLIYVALAGGALAGVVLIIRKSVRSPAVVRRAPWLAGGRWRETPIPYCAAIAAGAFLTLPHTPFLTASLADAAGY